MRARVTGAGASLRISPTPARWFAAPIRARLDRVHGQGMAKGLDVNTREVRISVRGLTCGMFVSRLDRPWLETSFPMQGVRVDSEEMLANFKRICTYVWVDSSAGFAPDPRFIVHETVPPRVQEARDALEIKRLRKQDWEVSTEFRAELPMAEAAHDSLRARIAEVMDDLRNGQRLDLDKLKPGVDAMVDSVLRNPAAFGWLKELKRRDDYSYQHALGNAIWAASFGRHLGMAREELEQLALGGMLCDIGKTQLPPELLAKHSPLSESDAALVRRHVHHSLEIVERTPGIPPRVIEIVATHHERHDGSGYPYGLVGTAIPIFGRIMGVVDSYDAMTCVRPYARSRSPHQAVAELYEQRGRQFQAELVEQFIQTCGIYPTGSLVELSTGEVGVVVEVHSLKRLRPRVMLLLDRDKLPLPEFRELDLGVVATDGEGQPLTVKSGLPVGAFGINSHELFLD
ncbi:HD-GYP domain-containing protein [Lysobacter olei]